MYSAIVNKFDAICLVHADGQYPPEVLPEFVKPILYDLWNLGLRVGHATRTLQECISYSKKELDVCTSILESRFIAGNKNIYKNLMNKYKREIVAKYAKENNLTAEEVSRLYHDSKKE